MKSKRLVLLSVVLGLMLTAGPAMATYMNLAADNQWNFSVTGAGTPTITKVPSAFYPLENFAAISGNAFDPTEHVSQSSYTPSRCSGFAVANLKPQSFAPEGQ